MKDGITCTFHRTTTTTPLSTPTTETPPLSSNCSNKKFKEETQSLSSSSSLNEGEEYSFLVTGFGPFCNVPSNPTTTIVRNLKQFLEDYNVVDDGNIIRRSRSAMIDGKTLSSNTTVQLLETAVADVKKKMNTFFLPNEESNSQQNKIILHLGVDSKARGYKIEARAFNEANFNVPDENGFQPCQERIDESKPLEMCLPCTLDLDQILLDLKENRGYGGGDDADVALSLNAGRFVCNYTYWYSLSQACLHAGGGEEIQKENRKEKSVTAALPQRKIHVLFVHVPPFHVKSEQDQMEFVVQVMESIRRSLLDQK